MMNDNENTPSKLPNFLLLAITKCMTRLTHNGNNVIVRNYLHYIQFLHESSLLLKDIRKIIFQYLVDFISLGHIFNIDLSMMTMTDPFRGYMIVTPNGIIDDFPPDKYNIHNLNDYNFTNCDFSQSDFTDICGEGIVCIDCDFTLAILNNSIWVNCKFIRCKLECINTDKVLTNVVFTNVEFIDCSFNNSSLKGAKLIKCKILRTTFTCVDLSNVVLEGSNIEKCSKLVGISFANAIIQNVSFHNCNLNKSSFVGTTFSNVKIVECFMDETIIAKTKCDKLIIKDTSIMSAVITNSDLTNVEFCNNDLDGAYFQGIKFSNVDFNEECDVNGVTFPSNEEYLIDECVNVDYVNFYTKDRSKFFIDPY